jgi:Ca2+-binding RTX toxin-like protein
MPRNSSKPSSGTSTIDLGALASKKNFDTFGPHPYTEEEDVPYFDFRSSKGKKTDLVVEGSEASEVVTLSWYDDLAQMGGGDDVAVGALGNDTISGGEGNDFLFGDTDLGITNSGSGDDDVISGNSGNDLLVGDAPYLINGAQGGRDTLTGGTGNDILWGDGNLDSSASGGADVFVFGLGSGDDKIMDFRQEDGDLIDVSGYGFDGLEDLTVTDIGSSTLVEFGILGALDSVELLNFDQAWLLTADDFIFA